MNSYHAQLLLEALCQVYSQKDLEDGRAIIGLLVRFLKVTHLEAEALVEGALYLKTLRAKRAPSPAETPWIQ
jgi:hypothetical protein